MIVQYGAFQLEADEAALRISKEAKYNSLGQRMLVTETWDMLLYVNEPTGTDAITTALQARNNAFNFNGQDLLFLKNDGITELHHALRSSETLGGTRVKRFDYPEGRGAEYSTYRTIHVVVEGDRPDTNVQLVAWNEQLVFSGSGPEFVIQTPLNGPPIKQIVHQQTPFTLIQTGSAVGFLDWPTIPLPASPADVHPLRTRLRKGSPERVGPHLRYFPIFWEYHHEFIIPVNLNPTPPPA